MRISELARRFNDNPLKDSKFLVNRDEELLALARLADNYDNSIVGVTGERGSGKTTVLNLFAPQGTNAIKLIVRIEEKDTKLDIIASLLRGICRSVQREKRLVKFKSRVQEALDFLDYQEERIHLMSMGVSHIAKFEKQTGNHRSRRYISSTIKSEIESILKDITRAFRIVLCIDEIDKETSKEVVHILDSLKGVLRREHLVVFVSLPPQIYDHFLRDEILATEDYNLDDIFKKIVSLPNLAGKDILEVINNRLGNEFRSSVAPEAKKSLVEYSRGNPRRAILPIYQALGTMTADNLPITGNDIFREILPPLDQYIDTLKLSPIQRDIVELLAQEVPNTTSKSDMSDLLMQQGVKKSTAYDNIQKLTAKGILVEVERDVYRVHSWVKLRFRAQIT